MNYVRFQRITKGEAFAGAFIDLQLAFEEASNPLSRHHVLYVWAQLEDVIRSYHYELRHTAGRVSKVYCPGQPIGAQADCVAFLRLLMHNKMDDRFLRVSPLHLRLNYSLPNPPPLTRKACASGIWQVVWA